MELRANSCLQGGIIGKGYRILLPYLQRCTTDIHIRQERHLMQQTQRRMSSDLVELRSLRADMRQLVDAVRILQSPSPLPANEPGLMGAPPSWPDPVQEEMLHGDRPRLYNYHGRINEHPHIKEEAGSAPATTPVVSQPGVQNPVQAICAATRSGESTAYYPPPWFKPVQPPPQPYSLTPAKSTYPTVHGGPNG